jgi:hypothetical protein
LVCLDLCSQVLNRRQFFSHDHHIALPQEAPSNNCQSLATLVKIEQDKNPPIRLIYL